jgi:hypothetical protein
VPAGGPGDHYLTDLTRWGLRPFGSPIDGLVLDILALGGRGLVDDGGPLSQDLWRAYAHSVYGGATLTDADRLDLVQRLAAQRDGLEDEARSSGWEVPARLEP